MLFVVHATSTGIVVEKASGEKEIQLSMTSTILRMKENHDATLLSCEASIPKIRLSAKKNPNFLEERKGEKGRLLLQFQTAFQAEREA